MAKTDSTPRIILPSRREFLTVAGALAGASMLPNMAWAQGKTTLANSLRSLTNPYHATFAKGGEAYAKAVGLPYVTLVTEGNSEKGIADVKALLAKTKGDLALCIDPNDSPDARVIVEECKKAGASVVTIWNKPDDMHPWDVGNSYVAHISFDGVQYGEIVANELFKAMGGSGGIVALGGIANNVPAIERKAGLDAALKKNPKVQLLDFQIADWNQTKALPIMQAWLTRFGSKIKGVWAANDGMGIGALEALRAEGLAGKIPVVGVDGIKDAVDAVKKGEFAATVDWDPFWVGGMGLSIAHHAKAGKFDPSKEPKNHREFYGTGVVVTKATVDQFLKSAAAPAKLNYDDLWGRVQGQIRYQKG